MGAPLHLAAAAPPQEVPASGTAPCPIRVLWKTAFKFESVLSHSYPQLYKNFNNDLIRSINQIKHKPDTQSYLVIPVHQILHFTTEDLDVRWPQKQHTKPANHLPLELQLCTRPRQHPDVHKSLECMCCYTPASSTLNNSRRVKLSVSQINPLPQCCIESRDRLILHRLQALDSICHLYK